MGGSGADISVQDSAAGLMALIGRIALEDSGSFFDWQGDLVPF
jgi:hypothetical protein